MNDKAKITHKLGDLVERVGEFFSKVGAKDLGKRIYNAGNRLEHKFDNVIELPKK